MKDDLFRLVKSLDAREVGIMNKHFKGSKGRQAQLFDKLRGQKHYNGERLKKALYGQQASSESDQFSVLKNQLFHTILYEIRRVHTPKAKDSKRHPHYEMTIRQWLDQIEVLQKKGFYEWSLNYIKWVKELAHLAEDWGYYFQVLKYEGYGKSKIYPNNFMSEASALGRNSRKIAERIEGFTDVYEAKTEMHLMALRDPLVRTEQEKHDIQRAQSYTVPDRMKETYYYAVFSNVVKYFGHLLLGAYQDALDDMRAVYMYCCEGEGYETARVKPFEWFQTLYFYSQACVFARDHSMLEELLKKSDEEYLGEFTNLWNFHRAHYGIAYLNRNGKLSESELDESFYFFKGMVDSKQLAQLPIEMQKIVVFDLQRTYFNVGRPDEAVRIYHNTFLSIPANDLRLDLDTCASYLYLLSLYTSSQNVNERQVAANQVEHTTNKILRQQGADNATESHAWDLLFLKQLKHLCKEKPIAEDQKQALRAMETAPYVKYINTLFPFNDKLSCYLC